MLDLSYNGISNEGAQHLGQALQKNTVELFFFFSDMYLLLYFNAEAYYVES